MKQLRIVAVGASAGGVEALGKFIESMPSDLEAAVLIVLHMPATARSVLPQILNRAQTLGATYPKNGQRIQPGRVYVAPPDYHMMVDGNDRIVLTRGPRENGCRPAVDPLFRSIAMHYGPAGIGVVLSGTLDDGTVGLRAIKQCGGWTIVQDPSDSLFPGMPTSAIESGCIDFIVPASDMGTLITDLLGRKLQDCEKATERAAVELSIDEMESSPDATKKLGDPAEFACPECGGTLWEISEEGDFRFRCRVGHAYTSKHLFDEQTVLFDKALWMALRALRERADLSTRLARRFRKSDNARSAERFELEAKQSHQEADTLLNLMRKGSLKSVSGVLPDEAEEMSAGNGAESFAPDDNLPNSIAPLDRSDLERPAS